MAEEEAGEMEKMEAFQSPQNHIQIKHRELVDVKDLHGAVSYEDKRISIAVKEIDDWVDENESTADADNCRERLIGIQAIIIDPIVVEAGLSGTLPKEGSIIHCEL
ncbi:hypothetical protein FRB94_010184 [Tulasnella sp. JGI-2019a]|nr:hypothetical protein FRB93_009888 [Tulasnella sp. JGI-2019a]KAG8994067.1 hypothetical protein FRB94_010184 [Tulasnella sp. JGI-2019a]KAG9023703.1 hypothetical protein FRB95_012622 [Tulasnella sp. JGI-2019a]